MLRCKRLQQQPLNHTTPRMETETILLPNKMHALMMRVCTKKNLTPSEMVANALRRHIASELPLAKLIVKAAAKLNKEGAK